jgi:hypothetical protein
MMDSISRLVQRPPRVLVLIALVISLAFLAAPIQHTTNISEPSVNPPRISSTPFRSAPIASAAPYDEQVGVTFTQDFPALAFNVSAVAFTDNGIGPGYLVNGLTDQGYWYQVGLSYNWPMTNGAVNPGFSMNYEVFSPNLASIYPTNGGGGIQPFTGTVNAGDSVLLSLSFSGGFVFMQAKDWQTGSVASTRFTSYAYNKVFVGLTSSLAQSGFFSGLMTEQYHYYPYYGSGLPVTYILSGARLSSAWMWMDEWNTNTGQLVFDANTTAPVLLNESVGNYFSSNGTAEIASANSLVTGLTPVTFPSLLVGGQATGQPGHRASIKITVEDQNGATIRFENTTILTGFGRYSFTLETAFALFSGIGQYNLTIDVPANLALGTYNLTVDVTSWNYLDTQAQVWIPLHPDAINETLLLTNNPPASNPPNNPGPSPPSTGQGPSRSTNTATFSPSSFLAVLRSMVLPFVGGYVALGFLAIALFLRQERRRSSLFPILGLRFCTNCGRELSPETTICPRCNFSAARLTTDQSQLPPKHDQTQGLPESLAS